jgi:hypothetical protein
MRLSELRHLLDDLPSIAVERPSDSPSRSWGGIRRSIRPGPARYRRPPGSARSRPVAPMSRGRRDPGLRHPVRGGQRLIACPLPDAALEVLQGCRCCTSWMPHDSHDLTDTPAPTAGCRRSVWEGRTLAVSAAALTDHVGDSRHRRAASKGSPSGLDGPHSRPGLSEAPIWKLFACKPGARCGFPAPPRKLASPPRPTTTERDMKGLPDPFLSSGSRSSSREPALQHPNLLPEIVRLAQRRECLDT